MDDKTLKNIEKWEAEIKSLESVKRQIKKFAKLKDEKADKEDIAVVNDKIVALFEDHKFMKLDWKEIKRSKASREEGLEKINKKIADRKKKLDAVKEEEPAAPEVPAEPEVPTRDWSEEIAACAPQQEYFHWAYGKMEVLAMEDDYIYLKLLDKKGCKFEWLSKNNAIVEIDGKDEEVKEFSITSIGKWLFPEMEDVDVVDKDKAHKIFSK